MDLKFSFGESNPLPISSQGAGSASLAPGSSVLELHVTLVAGQSAMRCEGLSADGVAYASAEKQLSGEDPASLAAGLRSVLARGGAELPDPLLGSVSAIALSLSGRETEALGELGLTVAPAGSPILAQVDESLQARTGIAADTPIRAL